MKKTTIATLKELVRNGKLLFNDSIGMNIEYSKKLNNFITSKVECDDEYNWTEENFILSDNEVDEYLTTMLVVGYEIAE